MGEGTEDQALFSLAVALVNKADVKFKSCDSPKERRKREGRQGKGKLSSVFPFLLSLSHK